MPQSDVKIIKAYHGVKMFYTNVSLLTKNKNNKGLHHNQQKHMYLLATWNLFYFSLKQL